MNQNILISDDDEGIISALNLLLKSEGYSTVAVNTPEQVLQALTKQDFSLVLIDLNYSRDTTSGDEGIQLISAIRKSDDLLPIIVMTGWGTIDIAVTAIKKGANDFIQKPWENDRLLTIIKNQIKMVMLQKRTQRLSQLNYILQQEVNSDNDIVAESDAINKVLDIIKQVASSEANVIFTGENGTGKSMYAQYLHDCSNRKSATLISVNMGAVSESLFESEMFGHIKGAFTDAKSSRIGRFELADESSLFLDEIANTPYTQQGKLLRVLEESQFEKVGSSKTQSVNIRLISATNSDLDLAVREGRFRKDLLYRINTIEIEIPPLRERVADIIPLAKTFLNKVAKKYSQEELLIDPNAERELKSYSWPGNVRELNHVMERAHILSNGTNIRIHDLGLASELYSHIKNTTSTNATKNDLRSLTQIEIDTINSRMNHFEGNAEKTALSLGISRSAFYRKIGSSKDKKIEK